MKTFTRTPLFVVALALALTGAASAAVPEQEEGWRIRANGFWVDGGGIERTDVPHFWYSSDDAGAGLGVNGEYRISPYLGVEMGLMAGAETDMVFVASTGPEGTFLASDTLAMSAVCAGLNVHLSPNTRADVYLGPMVAYVNYENIAAGSFGPGPIDRYYAEVRFENDLAFGASLGLDVPVGKGGWLFNANVRYIASELDGSGPGPRQTVDHDPLFVGVGFGYRF